MAWIKVESNSRPGRFYFFNVSSKESSWKQPAGYLPLVVDSQISAHGVSSRTKTPLPSKTESLVQQRGSQTKGRLVQQQGSQIEAGRLVQQQGSQSKESSLVQQQGSQSKASSPIQQQGSQIKAGSLVQQQGSQIKAGRLVQQQGSQSKAGSLVQQQGSQSKASSLVQQQGSQSKAGSLVQQQGVSSQTRTPKTDGQVRQQKSGSLHLQANSNNCMERVSLMVDSEVTQPEEEAMEIERWGDEEEISMDVDMSEEEQLALITEINLTRTDLPLASSLESFETHSTAADSKPLMYCEKLYLILDTNILLSHLGFLAELKDCAIKAVGRPVLVIPWVVMQELDALKARQSQALERRARQAIRFLHECFESHHPRVRGQTMEEVRTEVSNIAISNNDDRILHCCMLYQEKVKGHGGIAVLFSNDVQLCSKAMINSVRALNRKTLLSELRILCKSKTLIATSYTDTHEYKTRVTRMMSANSPKVKQSSSVQRTPGCSNRALMDDLLCESEALVRDALAAVITKEMTGAYGAELWDAIVVVKPPWTLKDTVYILDKHWVAVFRAVVANYHQTTNIPRLLQHCASRSSMLPVVADIQTFQFHSLELLRAFAQESDYNGVIPYSIAGLTVLSDKLNEGHGVVQSPTTHQHAMTPSHATPPSGHMTSPSSQVTVPLITSLLSPTCDDIIRLSGAIPQQSLKQLGWVLTVVMGVTKHCHSRILLTIQSVSQSLSDRQEATIFLSQLIQLLDKTTTSIKNLLENGAHLPYIQDVLRSFELFLQTSLQKKCPLSLESFVTCVQTQEAKVRQMLREAFESYHPMLVILQGMVRQITL